MRKANDTFNCKATDIETPQKMSGQKNTLKTGILKFYRHCHTAELTSGGATIHRRYLFHLLPYIYQITLSLSSCLLNVYQITDT